MPTPRCQYRNATGRQCASLAGDRTSGLCLRHAANAPASSPDFREALTRDAYDFQRPQGVNNSLGVLYNLLAEGRISPRRASVLAYISSLLLRTLPAIDYDNEHYTYNDAEPDEQRLPNPLRPQSNNPSRRARTLCPQRPQNSPPPSSTDTNPTNAVRSWETIAIRSATLAAALGPR